MGGLLFLEGPRGQDTKACTREECSAPFSNLWSRTPRGEDTSDYCPIRCGARLLLFKRRSATRTIEVAISRVSAYQANAAD